jgi:hypothetical protein
MLWLEWTFYGCIMVVLPDNICLTIQIYIHVSLVYTQLASAYI